MKTINGILREFQVTDSLKARGYISSEMYEKYKQDTASKLLLASKEKRSWWRIW